MSLEFFVRDTGTFSDDRNIWCGVFRFVFKWVAYLAISVVVAKEECIRTALLSRRNAFLDFARRTGVIEEHASLFKLDVAQVIYRLCWLRIIKIRSGLRVHFHKNNLSPEKKLRSSERP